jgi:hypothetical protein
MAQAIKSLQRDQIPAVRTAPPMHTQVTKQEETTGTPSSAKHLASFRIAHAVTQPQHLAKVDVEGSNPFSRSENKPKNSTG